MAVTDKSDYEDDLLEDIQEYEYQEMFEKASWALLRVRPQPVRFPFRLRMLRC